MSRRCLARSADWQRSCMSRPARGLDVCGTHRGAILRRLYKSPEAIAAEFGLPVETVRAVRAACDVQTWRELRSWYAAKVLA